MAEDAQLNWSRWIRQTHRWLSIVFTVAVIINGVTLVKGKYNNRLGEGYVSVFQQKDADHYELLAKVPSALGARTAGYFGKGKKGLERLFVAAPARADHRAEIFIYTVQD